ncbi:MAG: hypothetical protein K2N05_08520 [Muribaculaceae bacterium]|nr:hypothetical protein [Muribaculaceae bacterium]
MKKRFLTIILFSAMLLPLGISAQSNGNNHRNQNTERTSSSRPGGNGNHGNPGNFNGGNRPGGNNNRPGNNNNRPGNNGNHRPGNGKPGNDHGYRPGGNHGHHGNSALPPGGNYRRPGVPNRWTPSRGHSVPAPGHMGRPVYHHPPRLGSMVRHVVGPGRYDRVWLVAPGQYAVRFFNNGRYYMQYIWPESGRYGNPFQIVMNAPGEWYAYGNPNQWYYDDGDVLRISVNGGFVSPWTLIPSVEININL